MKLSHSVKICGICLVTINLIVAFCTIWLFLRIVPAIDLIVKNNVMSLEASKDMLVALSVIENENATKKDLHAFRAALKNAKENISKEDEKIAIAIIERSYQKAFNNDIPARKEVRFAIDYLFQINQEQIIKSNKEATEVNMAGAWGLVFMALFIFFATMLFLRKLENKLLIPMEELFEVIKSYKKNDSLRRCVGVNLNSDVKFVFDGINDLLDERIKYE